LRYMLMAQQHMSAPVQGDPRANCEDTYASQDSTIVDKF
jgi:hypothetical protein